MKGISPLIASVLLIAFTVSVAMLFQGWTSGITKTTTQNISSQAINSVACSSAVIKIENVFLSNGSNCSMVVLNEGGINLNAQASLILTNGTSFSSGIYSVPKGTASSMDVENCSITCSKFSKAIASTSCSGVSHSVSAYSKTRYMEVPCTTCDSINTSVSLLMPMNENTSSIVHDYSNYGNNGSLEGPVWTSGKYDSGLYFDGINDYLNLNSTSSLNLENAFTITGWFKPNQTFDQYSDYYQGILDKGTYQLFLDRSDGKLKFYLVSDEEPMWSSLDYETDEEVNDLIVWNGSLYASGWFTTAGGVSANRTARWNGSEWSALGSGMNSYASCLIVWNGSLYAAGGFTTAGGVPANYTARWNGTEWSALGSGMYHVDYCWVGSFAVWNGSLYASGWFTTAGGVSANYIARWNGSEWSALGSGMNTVVSSIIVWNGSLYAGGSFTTAGGVSANRTARWNGSEWSALGSGVGEGIQDVSSLAVWNGSLYAGGSFTTAGGVSANRTARWNGSEWSALGSGMNDGVASLAVWNGSLYAAGFFSSAGGVPVNYTARWNGSEWSALGSGVGGGAYTAVYSLTVWNGSLYAGGSFTTAGEVSANYIAIFEKGDLEASTNTESWPSVWTHFAIKYDGLSIKIYKNGILDGIVDGSITPSQSNLNLYIGKTYGSRKGGFSTSGSEQFNGIIDEVKIYSRALSEDEIRAEYYGMCNS